MEMTAAAAQQQQQQWEHWEGSDSQGRASLPMLSGRSITAWYKQHNSAACIAYLDHWSTNNATTTPIQCSIENCYVL